MKIGVVADDHTGATDVALALFQSGLTVDIHFGPPTPETVVSAQPDAVVIGLKTRTAPSAEAVKRSTQAGKWLLELGASMLYYKYCSTFDSTRSGNIGPILDALSDLTGVPNSVTTPATPEHGRTVEGGDLFVFGVPLDQTSMRHHPLTPMTDANVPRLLSAQTKRPVHMLDEAGSASATRRDDGYLVADAMTDEDLLRVAAQTRSDRLVSGAAGLARALGQVLRSEASAPATGSHVRSASGSSDRAAVLVGSASARTREQLAHVREAGLPLHQIDLLADSSAAVLARIALDWFETLATDTAAYFVGSLEPDQVRVVQERIGKDRSADLLEKTLGHIAVGLRDRGTKRIIVAGGETSGAVTTALGVKHGTITGVATTGVPWIYTHSSAIGLTIALKSGNFGAPNFLVEAAR
ncbi:3-oxo-tetronate kinase [Sciscionella sediminilitoris]|uniref:3-oxo-tetronate kinase n=1 Tax=Sciscionella sediminilitoris TaxID=1445613 RepID=UPI0004DED479|nr:3-oxo-tetronate kinase [Sciscionella sp. SE31]